MKKLLIFFCLLLLPLSFSFTTHASKEPVRVVRVVDGDTIEVTRLLDTKSAPEKYKVRLIGIDTPETKHPKKGVEYYGKEAFEFTKYHLLGKIVYLEYDIGQYDRYKRLLAYVWFDEKETNPRKMFNSILLLEGYAQLMTIQPNVRYVDYFKKYQTEARESNEGLWR